MYRRLMEHLSTAVLLLDDGLRLCWMNPAAEALFAVSLGRVQGHRLTSLV
ncbi:MAG: PAS domain-containing protein, partial [Halomonadaceae bacterium]|nr:PAS domain-containing protein [Halomonadaceae bacterium]